MSSPGDAEQWFIYRGAANRWAQAMNCDLFVPQAWNHGRWRP